MVSQSLRNATIIQRELAIIINQRIKNTQVGYINITEVRVTKDSSFATVYYTILSDDKKILESAKNLLLASKVAIRMELAKKISDIKRIPELIFQYDEALAYGNHINDILKTIK